MLISRSDTKEKVESHTRYVMVLDNELMPFPSVCELTGKY